MTGDILTAAALLACAVAGLALAVRDPPAPGGLGPKSTALAAFALAVAVRLVLSLMHPGAAHDLASYRIVGDQLRAGSDVFRNPALQRQNYPPVEVWWSALSAAAAPAARPGLFAVLVKLPFWLADAAIAPLLAYVGAGGRARTAAWLYALNPVAITISAVHGQFDSWVLLPLVLALAAYRTHEYRHPVWLALATAMKSWPIFFLPTLLLRLPAGTWWKFVAVTAAGPAAAFTVYALVHGGDIGAGVSRMLLYTPPPDMGTGPLLRMTGGAASLARALSLVTVVGFFVVAIITAKTRQVMVESVAAAMLLTVAISPFASAQYYAWPIPLLHLAGRLRLAAVISAALTPGLVYLELLSFRGASAPLTDAAALLGTAIVAVGVVFLLARPTSEPEPT